MSKREFTPDLTVRSPRILRIFRARILPGQEAAWERSVDDQVTDDRLESTDGLLQWIRGRPLNGDSGEFVFVTLWRDKDALRAFAGAAIAAVLRPGQADLVESFEVEHYEMDRAGAPAMHSTHEEAH